MNEYMKENQKFWDEVVPLHARSKFYDLETFKKTKNSLLPVELKEVGEVKGKSMLHLQCHFGMDTLSWAKRGAKITGVDFSKKAIDFATHLAEEIQLEARFIHSNVYDLPNVLDEKFDIVYMSYGVLCWLDDLKKLGKVIVHFLKPDGIFYIVENHPFLDMLEEENGRLAIRYSYFKSEPSKYVLDGTYATSEHPKNNVTYEWTHTMSEIVTSFVGNGMKLEFLHEFPFLEFKFNSLFCQREDKYWEPIDPSVKVPLMFSIKAKKSGSLHDRVGSIF